MKLFLAGADTSYGTEIRYLANATNHLTTFFAHQNGFSNHWIKWYKKTKNSGADWIMDSGLFTMMFGACSNKTYTEKELVKYAYKYINSLKKIKYNDTIVEMDVHKVLGLQALKRFRTIFEKEWLLEKTIYVWHIEEKEKGFRKLCKKYPYIAISIPELRKDLNDGRTLKNAVKQLISIANLINPNIKIHLLGCTQQNLMEQKGYYSCDSTSWLSGGRYGNVSVWVKNKIKSVPVKTKSYQAYKRYLMHEWNNIHKKLNYKSQYLTPPGYIIDIWLGAKTFIKLNQYINNKYFNFEVVKKYKNE